MNKLTIPALLLGVVMIAGAFAFMPIQEASTVHTTIQASTQKITTTVITATATDDDFRITCPAGSAGCIIHEIFLNNDHGGNVDVDQIFMELNNQTDLEISADVDNAQIGTGLAQVLANVGNIAIPTGDSVCVEMTGGFTSTAVTYSLEIVASVEGDQTAMDVAIVADADACAT